MTRVRSEFKDDDDDVASVRLHPSVSLCRRDFLIYQDPGKPPVHITDNKFKDKVQLCFLNGNHYDSIYPISQIKNSALCQSILYEVLYDDVFKVDRNSLGSCLRSSRSSDLLSDDSMPACPSSDGSDLDTNETQRVETASTRHNNQSYRGRGRGRQLPERVRRSLNPNLFRNVEYDVWHKSKRAQQRMDYCIAAGMQYTAGDRCQVSLDGRHYSATIKEVPSNNNKVVVHIEELGSRHVSLWRVHPPNEESSWSTVVNKDKKLSNGCGDREERGKGRGRGKTVSSSSSQPAASSTGRVQKQHSWPPQATVDEQGGAKTTRKSVSVAEQQLFGLTDKERLAKEEEERNVALVEIQLRDEHSFPALGIQTAAPGDGGKKKGGDKRRSQRNKTRSPVDDVTAGPPPTPPPVTSDPGRLLKASTSAATGSAPTPPPACAAPTPKANTQSYALAATPSSPLPPPAAMGGAPPQSAAIFTLTTPVLPPASSPLSSSSPPPSSSSKLPPSSSYSAPPPPSSVPPPTFIAPIAPSPTAAQGFLPRSSPPVPSLPHSSSPPSPSSPTHVQIQEAPPDPAQTPGSAVVQSPTSSAVSQTQTQASQTHPPLPQSQIPMPQIQPQCLSEGVLPGPQILTQDSLPQVLQPVQSQSEMVQGQSPPHPTTQPTQPPPPSQLPLPSLSISSTQNPNLPSLQTQTINTQNQSESESPAHPPPQQSHPHQLLPAHPAPQPHPPSIPGTVPLQNLSQLYLDPLYPGFPQGEKGEAVPPPPFSSSKTGDDLPQDVNILRFFFNLGVKAYSMPLLSPYIYLLPLHQAHTISRSASPTFHLPPSSTPTGHQEAYTHYPPVVPPQYDHQPQPPEPLRPSEPSFGHLEFPGNQLPPPRMHCNSLQWQQHQLPPSRSSSYPVGYPVAPPRFQGYHPGQSPGHPLYPPAIPPYPTSSLGYQSTSTPDELQGSQGLMEQLQPLNGDTMQGHGPGRAPGPPEGPPAANMANANNNRAMVVPNSFAMKMTKGESSHKTVLLVDPPLNDTPIVALVSNSDTMLTINPGSVKTPVSVPGNNSSAHAYRLPQKVFHSRPYVPQGAPEPGKVGHLGSIPVVEGLSVGCSTEDNWEEPEFKLNSRGSKRGHRGGRGRGGNRRRQGGEPGVGYHAQFVPSYRGRGY
uniref:Uncharacterized protein n=1 Tax=Echeneis naucrates TaxID=173247 RepID=A0A665TAC2_ECHNA